MSSQARRMGADRLAIRLEVPNPDDELGQLAETFNGLFDRIESTFARMRQFVTDASHELRTPVAVIRGEADVALTPPTSPDEVAGAVEVIRDEARRLGRIVDDMFLLARADAHELHLAREEVFVAELVASCARAAASIGSARGVEVRLGDLPTSDVACLGDRDRLAQMLMNLVDNATKYAGPGSHVLLDARVERDEGPARVAISVEDDGPGIPPEYQAAVFERFFCVDKARTRRTGGSGLGLPIARWVAWAHGGTLSFAPAAGGGCRFTATLPIATEGAGRPASKLSGTFISASSSDR
jgi:signal transduction histidine kinase